MQPEEYLGATCSWQNQQGLIVAVKEEGKRLFFTVLQDGRKQTIAAAGCLITWQQKVKK